MQVPVGNHFYDLRLVCGYIEVGGQRCLGLCDSDRQRIFISSVPPPFKRLSTFWHELAHAWLAELDVHEADVLAHEPICNLVGLAMAKMNASTLARIHILLSHGIECDDVMYSPSLPQPIPVLQFSQNVHRPPRPSRPPT